MKWAAITAMRPRPAKQARSCAIVLAVVAIAATGGCHRGPKLRSGWSLVSGSVTYQGKPLPGGEVMLCIDKDGAAILRGGPIQEDGTFAIDAPVGQAKVAIHTTDLKKAHSSRYVEIPAKYANPEGSGLSYDVKPGENKDVKFELQ